MDNKLLKFKAFSNFKPGLIYNLLTKSYALLLTNEEKFDQHKKFQDADTFFFSNIQRADRCGFVSVLEKQPIGFSCWDPRERPIAIIGHNCILPEHKGNRFGILQMKETLRRLKNDKFKTAKVSTGLRDDFLPARKMYENCGFKEVKKDKIKEGKIIPLKKMVYYELNLK